MTTSQDPLYAGYRCSAELISYAVWLYFRFLLSLRMVEEMLVARYVAVVELDDGTHDTAEQQEEDKCCDYILLTAGIRVVRLRYGADTTIQTLAEWCVRLIPHKA